VERERYVNWTDKIRNVVAIGETTSWSMSWSIINAIRRSISTCSGSQVIVISIINKWISKHKECPWPCFCTTHNHSNYCNTTKNGQRSKTWQGCHIESEPLNVRLVIWLNWEVANFDMWMENYEGFQALYNKPFFFKFVQILLALEVDLWCSLIKVEWCFLCCFWNCWHCDHKHKCYRFDSL